MSRLHLLNKSPDHRRFQQCLEALAAGDSLVLLENAVYGFDRPSQGGTLPSSQIFLLEADCQARDIQAVSDTKQINYDDLAELISQHPRLLFW